MRDYSSLINPRHRVSQLTSEQEESKPVRFVERRRRSAVEEVGSRANIVHLQQFEDVGAKVRSGVGQTDGKCMAGYVCCSLLDPELSPGPDTVRLTRQPVTVETVESPARSRCGVRTNPGVVGRVASREREGETQLGEYPWHAAILQREERDNLYICGGSLLDTRHVLTAAHCLSPLSTDQLRVRLGEWDVNSDAEFYPNLEYSVESIVVHPQYQEGNLYNDLAVVRLSSRVDTDQHPHIGPICLPHPAQSVAGRRCYVSGWGKDVFGPNGTYHNTLKEVDVPVLLDFDCERKLKKTRLGSDFVLHPG